MNAKFRSRMLTLRWWTKLSEQECIVWDYSRTRMYNCTAVLENALRGRNTNLDRKPYQNLISWYTKWKWQSLNYSFLTIFTQKCKSLFMTESMMGYCTVTFNAFQVVRDVMCLFINDSSHRRNPSTSFEGKDFKKEVYFSDRNDISCRE